MTTANPKTSFQIRNRDQLEGLEARFLAPFATQSRGAHATRRYDEPEHRYRTAFQRDRDRIIHSRAFRRLKHKRQVFLTTESDHYRTRITHTMEVAQLARTMARTLGLNEDLVEAIALGHDLGHTPFGHLGEVVLDDIMSGRRTFQAQQRTQNFGGFKHNYQSVRVVDMLEKKYSFDGLNLTAQVREGMLKHTRLKRGRYDFPDFYYDGLRFECDVAATLEGQVVALCDEIAQRTHDLEDGIRAGLVQLQQVRELDIVRLVEKKLNLAGLVDDNALLYKGLLITGLINFLVDDVIATTLERVETFSGRKHRLTDFDEEIVQFSAKVNPLQKQLNKFIYKEIIDYSRVKWSDELGEKCLFRLFESYYRSPEMLPDYVLKRYFGENHELKEDEKFRLQHEGTYFRLICDHVAGMTDAYAVREAERLSRLGKFDADDLNLGVVLGIEQHI